MVVRLALQSFTNYPFVVFIKKDTELFSFALMASAVAIKLMDGGLIHPDSLSRAYTVKYAFLFFSYQLVTLMENSKQKIPCLGKACFMRTTRAPAVYVPRMTVKSVERIVHPSFADFRFLYIKPTYAPSKRPMQASASYIGKVYIRLANRTHYEYSKAQVEVFRKKSLAKGKLMYDRYDVRDCKLQRGFINPISLLYVCKALSYMRMADFEDQCFVDALENVQSSPSVFEPRKWFSDEGFEVQGPSFGDTSCYFEAIEPQMMKDIVSDMFGKFKTICASVFDRLFDLIYDNYHVVEMVVIVLFALFLTKLTRRLTGLNSVLSNAVIGFCWSALLGALIEPTYLRLLNQYKKRQYVQRKFNEAVSVNAPADENEFRASCKEQERLYAERLKMFKDDINRWEEAAASGAFVADGEWQSVRPYKEEASGSRDIPFSNVWNKGMPNVNIKDHPYPEGFYFVSKSEESENSYPTESQIGQYGFEHFYPEDDEEIHPQGIAPIAITAFLSTMFARKIPFYRKVCDMDKLHRNGVALLAGGAGSLETMINFVLSIFGKQPISILRAHVKLVNDWDASVSAFTGALRLGKLDAMAPDIRSTFMALRDQGLTHRAGEKEINTLKVLDRGLDRLHSVASFFPPDTSGGGRMEPLVLALSGPPGAGKSFLARYFASILAKRHCTQAEIDSVGGELDKLVYQKGTSKYWEGYCGQPICVMDDWMQAVTKPGDEDNEVVNFIRACNQWPYPLNMASLELKSKLFFRSRIIIITTNNTNDYHIAKMVTSPTAVTRRIDHHFNLVLGSEQRGKFFDVSKLKDIKTLSDFDDVWVFQPWDLATGHRKEDVDYTLKQVVAKLSTSYNFRHDMEKTNRTAISNMVDVSEEIEVPVVTQGAFGNAAIGILATIAVVKSKNLFSRACKIAKTIVMVKDNVSVCSKVAIGAFVKALPVLALASVCSIVKMLWGFLKTVVEYVMPGADKKRITAQNAPLRDEVALRLQSNLVEVYREFRGNTKRTGFAIACDPLHVFVPYHFLREAEVEGSVIYIVNDHKRIVLNKQLLVYSAPKAEGAIRDLALLKMPVVLKNIRNIHSHFRDKNTPAAGHALFLTKESAVPTFTTSQILSKHYTGSVVLDRIALVQHDLKTIVGQCGSIVMMRNLKKTHRILGMHVAGSDTGYYCPLYSQDLPVCEPQMDKKEIFDGTGGIVMLDQVKPLWNSGQSNIEATAFAGTFGEVDTAPAKLRPVMVDGVLIDPMLKAIESTKRDFSSINIPQYMETCAAAVVGELFSTFNRTNIRKLTFEEAVMGVQGEQYIKGIARNKSPGYPYCREQSDKRKMFGVVDFEFGSDECKQVRKDIDTLIEAYRRGDTTVVYRDVLKDEVRGLVKVNTADTRLISASPVHYTILCRMYYGTFCSEFMRTRLQHGGMVGVNPYSYEWGVMENKFSCMNKDHLVGDGDFKKYDKSQHPVIMQYMFSEINDILETIVGDRFILDGIAKDTYHSVHIGGDSYTSDIIYQKVGSLPSGHGLTSVLNCMFVMIVFRGAWVDMYGIDKVLDFRDRVQLSVYGDDNKFAPRDDTLAFNFMTIKNFCPKIGMEYTPADKGANDYTLHNLAESQFLKRTSREEDGYIYAPLEVSSIFDMINWRKKKTTDYEHLDAIARTFYIESAAQGRDFYLKNVHTFRRLMSAFGVMDPMRGMALERSYPIALAWYRGYVPSWSSEYFA